MIDPSTWLVLLSMGMPGPVILTRCDGSRQVVAESTQSFRDVRPTTLADIKFRPDADAWARERVADLLRWNVACWTAKGCVTADGKYDPPPPPMKCPQGEPVS